MGWRFHKSFTVIPGLRVNLSKSGLSASIGGAPFTLNVGPNGLMGTASIPGTGISYRHHFSSGPQYSPNETAPSSPSGSYPNSVPVPSLPPASSPSLRDPAFTNIGPVEEIHSSSTELLTSATLKELKNLIGTAYRQHEEISTELSSARAAEAEAERRFTSWEQGFLFRRLFKNAFQKRREIFETETAHVEELEEQLKLSKIMTQIELESEQAELFFRLRDKFSALTECDAIWDIKTRQATDQFHERTAATTSLSRERVRFEISDCDLIDWDQKVPHLRNSKGGDMYLFPGFILYRASREAFSLLEYHDVTSTTTNRRFHEEEGVPADSVVVGQTWKWANKDGSRDKRFAQNYPIPIAEYGALTLKSESGLWEEFHFSNPQKLVSFDTALYRFTESFARFTNDQPLEGSRQGQRFETSNSRDSKEEIGTSVELPVKEDISVNPFRSLGFRAARLRIELKNAIKADVAAAHMVLSFESTFDRDITHVLFYFAKLRGLATPNAGEVCLGVLGVLDPNRWHNFSGGQVAQVINNSQNANRADDLKPILLPFAYGADAKHGTLYAKNLASLLYEIARTVASANGLLSERDNEELERFQKLLDETLIAVPDWSAKHGPSTDSEEEQSHTLQGAVWNLLNIASELDEPIRRMTEHAKIIGTGGVEQKFSTLRDWINMDLAYLVSRFSMKDPRVASRRACLLAQIMSIFNGTDPALFAEPSERNKSVVQVHSDLIRNAQAGDLGFEAGRGVNPSSFAAFQLVQKHDELVGTKNTVRLVTEYLSIAKVVAASDDDEDSRATLAKVQGVLSPAREEATPSRQQGSFEDLLEQLNGLVGLSRVKADVTQLVNYIKVQQLRKQQGLKTPDLSLHVVFYGNPGTGKTTVARLIAQLYCALGVLSKGQLVETDRSGLVAGYVGQTALKVKEVVERALGGVLFIDEAYSLKPASGTNDYGDEAIDALIKSMEDHRDQLVVVVAGYTAPMERFLEANPGIKSRFNKYLVFEDYSPVQLIEIFRRFCEQSDYSLSKDAEGKLLALFQDAFSRRDETFGNARLARNVFERSIANLASRIVKLERPEQANLQLIEAADIELPETLTIPERPIGFSVN